MAKSEELSLAQEGKLKALQAAMSKIEKDFGKGSIMKLGDEQVENVEVIPTGSIGLDAALGVGGYPKGRIIEIYGPESSGKTTLAIHAIAESQKAGGIAAFIDAEHAFDRFYAAKLGVDVDNLWISQPDNGEQALEIADQLIRSSAIDIISLAKDNSDANVRKMVLEARALRAMSYYWVIDIFGQGSFILDTDPMGTEPEQKDRLFLYNWLDSELDAIEAAYTAEFPNDRPTYGHVGLDGVQALHARLCLNAQVYTSNTVNAFEKCQTLCEAVINRHKGGGFNGSGLANNYMYLFCGYESSKWMGQCPGCHEWNTFVEEVVDKKTAAKAVGKQSQPKAKPQTLSADLKHCTTY